MTQTPKYLLTTQELASLMQQTETTVLQTLPQDSLEKLPGGRLGIPPAQLKAYLSDRGVTYTPRVIAFINLKGGTGKTTSAITVATRAVQYGFKTCLLDLDPQASASLAFHQILNDDGSIFCDIWARPQELVSPALRQLDDYLWLLPSSLENSMLDLSLMNPAAQKHAVQGVCAELQTQGMDLAIIDCPPSLGTAVISTICAANIVVIPVCADIFSLKGLALTVQEIESICTTFHLTPPIIKVLFTKFDRRLSLSEDILRQLQADYPQALLPAPIRTSSEFSKVLQQHVTVFAASRPGQAREDYDRVTRDLLAITPTFQRGERL